ncbi:phage neck terminator protein [Pseudomonas fungipugnans]|uniref:phage neck terminator protein n=1 Tax=Pseudomonas fungipugnans TaxID=3024217 RepID=UPI003D753348
MTASSSPRTAKQSRRSAWRFFGASNIRPAPELVNQQWIRRYDLFIYMRRQVVRVYPVLNILSADPVIVD